MSKNDTTTITVNGSTFAPLRNVILASKAMEILVHREPNEPGMGAFYGDSGLGKSMAAAFVANRYRAVYVECRSYFTKKSLLLSILEELGLQPGKTIYEMVRQIGAQLDHSRQPLIIDEMDHIVDRNLVELLRDVYEVSQTPILMIGEERFPAKLRKWERFHNRMLIWQPAERTDLEDTQKLAKLYSSDVELKTDLLEFFVKGARGVARRIVVNISTARREAKDAGKRTFSLADWGSRPVYNGEPPRRAT